MLNIFFIIILLIITYNIIKVVSYKLFNNNTEHLKLIKICFIFKIIGTLSYSFIYLYIYEGGDTINFFDMSEAFNESLKYNPSVFIQLFNIQPENYSINSETAEYIYKIQSWARNEVSSYTIIRTAAIFNILTFNSFIGTTILFSTFAFIGQLLILKVLTFYSNYNSKIVIISCLILPSLLFWCSGINKDSLIIAYLGLTIFSIHKMNIRKGIINIYLPIFLISIYFLANIKLYVLISLTITALILNTPLIFSKIKHKINAILFTPIIFIIILGFIFSTINYLPKFGDRYDINKIERQIYGVQVYHKEISNYESGYELNIGKSPKLLDQLKATPEALFTTLFKPYIWQVRSPLILTYAIENLILISLFIFLLINGKLLKFFKIMISNKIILYSIIFIITFSTIVGLLSFNFGALARYRTPMLPFLTFVICYGYHFCFSKNNVNAES